MNLDLTIDQVNVVLHALAQLPYVQSAPLIDNIRDQAKEQLEAQQEQMPAPEQPPVQALEPAPAPALVE